MDSRAVKRLTHLSRPRPRAGDFSDQEQWGTLYGQLSSCGFDTAALQWINGGNVPNVNPTLLNQIYNYLCANAGLTQGWGYFYNNLYGAINASVLNNRWTNNTMPAVNAYGVPSSNYGHQCSLAHFASVLGGSSVSQPSDAPLRWPPIGKGQIRPANRPAPPPPPPGGDPGPDEDFCWYMNAFLAWVGIMCIPLALDGAAFPPLGVGLGIAVAFASAFAWGFC